MKCPYCGLLMDCDSVDIGVGFQQCGPYYCDGCGASEIGPEGVTRSCDADEAQTGFYKNRHSPYANTVDGNLVSHRVAKAAYRVGRLDPKPSDP